MKIKKLKLLLILLSVAVISNAADFEVGGIAYNVVSLDNLTCEVASKPNDIKYRGHITIPDNVTFKEHRFTVVAIGEKAFSGSKITSIVLPNTITEFKERAFSGCDLLTSIKLPQNLSIIGNSCFASSNLISISFPITIKQIDSEAFSGCKKMTSFTIPDSITSLSDRLLWGCSSLKKIIWHNNVYSIGESCFLGCTSLISVTIPQSIDTIGPSCFSGCKGLSHISLPKNLKYLPHSCFSGCASLSSIELPDSILDIGVDCFNACNSLITIRIPENVKEIKETTFRGCQHLKNVIFLGEKVHTIGPNAFYECSALSNIKLPKSIRGIERGAFSYCTKLVNIDLPPNLRYIDQYAFSHVNPKKFVLPPSFVYLGIEAWSVLETLIIQYSEKPFKWDNDMGQYAQNLWIDRDFNAKSSYKLFYKVQNLKIGPHEDVLNKLPLIMRNDPITITSVFPEPPHVAEFRNSIYLNTILYVPDESLELYKADSVWGKFLTIKPMSQNPNDIQP